MKAMNKMGIVIATMAAIKIYKAMGFLLVTPRYPARRENTNRSKPTKARSAT